MTTCANCQTAEASYLCAGEGDYRCGYCRTLARRPEEYRPMKAAAPKASVLDVPFVFNPWQATLTWPSPARPYVASVGDRVKVVEDWGQVAFSSPAPQLIGTVGAVIAISTPLQPTSAGVRLPQECRYYTLRNDAGILHFGWFVVEKAP